MDVFPVILPSHLQIGDQNGQKKSTFFGCTQSNGFTMSRILNLVKKLEKSQPISVKLVTKIVKKNRPFLGVSNRMGLRWVEF